jgi:hypothetical protein
MVPTIQYFDSRNMLGEVTAFFLTFFFTNTRAGTNYGPTGHLNSKAIVYFPPISNFVKVRFSVMVLPVTSASERVLIYTYSSVGNAAFRSIVSRCGLLSGGRENVVK